MPKYDRDGNVKTVNAKTTTKYNGKQPERYLALCKEGGSIPEFCLLEMITRQTFDSWCDKYPPMAEAKRLGKQIAEGWWINQARSHLVIHNDKDAGTTKFDTNLYKFYTGGRFGHTSDRDAHERLNKIEQRLESQDVKQGITSAYAEEGEYEIDDNPPK